MADLSDVLNAVVGLLSPIIYPAGESSPSAITAMTRNQAPGQSFVVPVKIYPGWPDPDSLATDLMLSQLGRFAAAHVSVFPQAHETNVTRFLLDDQEDPILPAPTYTVQVSGRTITTGGQAPTPYFAHNVGIRVGGVYYVAQAQAGDSAAALAGRIGGALLSAYPGTMVADTVVTLPDGAQLQRVNLGVTGSLPQNITQQRRTIQISLWAPRPDVRDTMAKLIGPPLANTTFLTLADGSMARFRYQSSTFVDAVQRQGIYRRDFLHAVEYATVINDPAVQIVAPSADVQVCT